MRVIVEPVDEDLLVQVLNSAPIVDGSEVDALGSESAGRSWLREHGLDDCVHEWQNLVRARELLCQVIRAEESATVLQEVLDDIRYTPTIEDGSITWALQAPHGREIATRVVLAWDGVTTQLPGRLRPCANPDCRLFLVDHSKNNTARWCSMAVCGNRMKARRHYARTGTKEY